MRGQGYAASRSLLRFPDFFQRLAYGVGNAHGFSDLAVDEDVCKEAVSHRQVFAGAKDGDAIFDRRT